MASTVCVNPDDFTTDASGRLVLRCSANGVLADDYPDCEVADLPDIYCSGDGSLKAPPLFRMRPIQGIADAPNNSIGNLTSGQVAQVTVSVDMNASDWCENGMADVMIGGGWTIRVPAGNNQARYEVTVQNQFDGNGFGAEVTLFRDTNPTAGGTVQMNQFIPDLQTAGIAAGTSKTYQARLRVRNTGDDPIDVQNLTAVVRGFMATRRD